MNVHPQLPNFATVGHAFLNPHVGKENHVCVAQMMLFFVIKHTVTTLKYTDFDYTEESFPWLAWPLEDLGFMEALWNIYG